MKKIITTRQVLPVVLALGLFSLTNVSFAEGGYCQSKHPGLDYAKHHAEPMEGNRLKHFFGMEPASREEHMLNRITAKLELTQNQQDQFRTLFQERSKARQAEREKFQSQLRALLTPEQQAKLANP